MARLLLVPLAALVAAAETVQTPQHVDPAGLVQKQVKSANHRRHVEDNFAKWKQEHRKEQPVAAERKPSKKAHTHVQKQNLRSKAKPVEDDLPIVALAREKTTTHEKKEKTTTHAKKTAADDKQWQKDYQAFMSMQHMQKGSLPEKLQLKAPKHEKRQEAQSSDSPEDDDLVGALLLSSKSKASATVTAASVSEVMEQTRLSHSKMHQQQKAEQARAQERRVMEEKANKKLAMREAAKQQEEAEVMLLREEGESKERHEKRMSNRASEIVEMNSHHQNSQRSKTQEDRFDHWAQAHPVTQTKIRPFRTQSEMANLISKEVEGKKKSRLEIVQQLAQEEQQQVHLRRPKQETGRFQRWQKNHRTNLAQKEVKEVKKEVHQKKAHAGTQLLQIPEAKAPEEHKSRGQRSERGFASASFDKWRRAHKNSRITKNNIVG